MSGKFLKREAIIDTIKSEERMNAFQKRNGLLQHPVRVVSCGCPDPNCGAFHMIITERTIPTVEECTAIIKKDNQTRKKVKRCRHKLLVKSQAVLQNSGGQALLDHTNKTCTPEYT
jgi:hypothetical protein